MMFTVALTTLVSSSFKHSRNRGQLVLRSSGDCKKHLYSTSTAFFRMFGDECVNFATKSGARSRASDGDAICESPLMASDISGTEPEVRSYKSRKVPSAQLISSTAHPQCLHLFDQIRSQHQHIRIDPEALNRGQIPHSLLPELWTAHDLQGMEARPCHVVAKHVEVDQL